MEITVVGLGKIGLPLAVQFASKGHLVRGVDLNQNVIDCVNAGIEPFPGEAGLDYRLSQSVQAGTLSATSNTKESVSYSDVVVVAVPLLVDKEGAPDFSALESATQAISNGLKPGTLVAYETTLPVGTTRNLLAPLLERGSGLIAGKEFSLVFSPERVMTGRVFEDLRKYPKLLGGIDQLSEEKGAQFYNAVLDFDSRPDLPKPNGVWKLGSPEAAEMAKLAETTYRDVNIALANQFAIHAEDIGVDVYQVIEACNSQSFSHIHSPGVAVGGHCIPVYPHLYLHGDPDATVVSASRSANKLMPEHVIDRVQSELGTLTGLKVLVLGLSYRGGVKESAFSGTWDLVKIIAERAAHPLVHDPMYSSEEIAALGLSPYNFGEPCDVVIVQADHDSYKNITPNDIQGAKFIVDGRNILSRNVKSAIKTHVLGVGNKLSH
jgi:nucleotide sugar dehydrogenase